MCFFKLDDKIKRIKEYLAECIRLEKLGVRYGIELISYDINSILDSQNDELVEVGSFLDSRLV